jgi:hypothetical protein
MTPARARQADDGEGEILAIFRQHAHAQPIAPIPGRKILSDPASADAIGYSETVCCFAAMIIRTAA